MKRMIMIGILVFSAGLLGSAVASPLVWNTTSSSSSCTNGVGNACSFTSDGHTLKARAYSTNNNSGSGNFEKATLTRWSGGLGVRNPDAWNEYLSPNHSLDNHGRNELIVFENNVSGYSFTGFEIGWRRRDSDMSAWFGTSLLENYDFTGAKFSDLGSLGFTQIDFNNVPRNVSQSLTPLAGNYLILAPRNSSSNDYVKISQISGGISVPPTQISEPDTAALLGIALLGFLANKRKKSE